MKRRADGCVICPEDIKRAKLNPHNVLDGSLIKTGEVKSSAPSEFNQSEKNDQELCNKSDLPRILHVQDSLQVEVSQTSLPARTDLVTTSDPVEHLRELVSTLPTNSSELRALIEKYPGLQRLLPKHTRVGDMYQVNIPLCSKSSAFNKEAVVGSSYDMKANLEAEARERKTIRDEMLEKIAEEKAKLDTEMMPPPTALSLTKILASSDLEEDDSDGDFDYDCGNFSKVGGVKGIIARRLDCLPDETWNEGKVQYLISWQDGTTTWEYEDMLDEELFDLIDNYLYREGLVYYEDAEDRDDDAFLVSQDKTVIPIKGKNLGPVLVQGKPTPQTESDQTSLIRESVELATTSVSSNMVSIHTGETEVSNDLTNKIRPSENQD